MGFPLKDYKEEIVSLKLNDGMGSRKIAEFLKNKYGANVSDATIRKFLKVNGASQSNTFEAKLEENKFEFPENYEYGWLKTKEASIFVRNNKGVTTFEEMREDFIEEMKSYSPSFEKIERLPCIDEHLLVVDIADLHIGKLASDSETKDEYNVDIAVDRATKGVAGILSKAKGFNIDKILFVIGNDVLHVDNSFKTTTSGTPQDVSGMWFDNYKIARKLYVSILESLVKIADVHVVHNPSNHDYVTGYMLADSVYSWFRQHPNITFDISNAHRKYFKYGVNLIGTSHGDGGKLEQLPLIMANEAKEEWSQTDWRYIYLHHLHHKKQFKFHAGNDYHGVTVEYLRSPSGTDSWHHKKGFSLAPKAVEAFVHHKEYGQVAKLIHLFK
jgi:hypothetical protein